MSKLEELIQELCPDGVEYKTLEKCCHILDKYRKPISKSFRQKGEYPYYGANGIQDYVTDYIFEGEFVLVGEDGSVLTSNNHPIVNWASELTGKDLKSLMIPLPPLPVQEEIVRILDNFTELTAELTAELTVRKKQYEYYRKELLSLDKNICNFSNNDLRNQSYKNKIEFRQIKDVFQRVKGTSITANKMKEINNESGDIRVFAGGRTVIDAYEKDIPKANITRVPAVLVQSRGIIDVIYYEKPFTFKNEMWAYTHKNKTTVKYLYYVLKNNIEKFRDTAAGMGSLPQISLRVTENFLIPLPSLEEQQRIVDILDRFDKLCNDISEVFPAEIEARQKQYVYYRDKLLTFKPLEEVK